jgi:hypothetical protein
MHANNTENLLLPKVGKNMQILSIALTNMVIHTVKSCIDCIQHLIYFWNCE